MVSISGTFFVIYLGQFMRGWTDAAKRKLALKVYKVIVQQSNEALKFRRLFVVLQLTTAT